MIGIFDSGSGGLTVLSAIRKKAPNADVVYFGDIGNAPYGTKSSDELKTLVEKGMQRLAENGATEMVVACNSVSFSVLAGAVQHERIVEMSRPTARMMRAHAGERVLLLATPATVESGLYRDALWSIVSLDELPVPRLASAIEEGKSHEEISTIVREALESRAAQEYDAVLLGCTHYPLVLEDIAREVGARWKDATIIDPADAVAEEVVQRFDCAGSGVLKCIISGDSHAFRNRIAPLFLESESTLAVI